MEFKDLWGDHGVFTTMWIYNSPPRILFVDEHIKNLIRSIKIFDIYEGENIPQDKKSIALNVTIQSSEKTLEESDLEKINKLIISTVETKSGAKIRS